MHIARVALPNMEPRLKIMAKVFYIRRTGEEDYLAEARLAQRNSAEMSEGDGAVRISRKW